MKNPKFNFSRSFRILFGIAELKGDYRVVAPDEIAAAIRQTFPPNTVGAD